MAINCDSQKRRESAGQIGCEACIKKDEIISDMYEALKNGHELLNAQTPRHPDDPILKITLKVMKQALAKAEGKE